MRDKLAPAVSHFLKEVTHQELLNDSDFAFFPSRILQNLYHGWIQTRYVSDIYRIPSLRIFSHIISNLDPDFYQLPPLRISNRTSNHIPCVSLRLRAAPLNLEPRFPIMNKTATSNIGSGIEGQSVRLPMIEELPHDLIWEAICVYGCNVTKGKKGRKLLPRTDGKSLFDFFGKKEYHPNQS